MMWSWLDTSFCQDIQSLGCSFNLELTEYKAGMLLTRAHMVTPFLIGPVVTSESVDSYQPQPHFKTSMFTNGNVTVFITAEFSPSS
jgi:hypothetical protein